MSDASDAPEAPDRFTKPTWDISRPGRRATPLRRDEALALLREHAAEIERRYGVRPVAVFGSVARDEARPDSDLDLIVEYARPLGLREYMGAIAYLEDVFDARVDLGRLEHLKPRARSHAERDLVRVA